MARAKKCKIVLENPNFTYFKPVGVPMKDLNEMILNIEEFEALRLKDLEKKGQIDCAKIMGVHQSTFQRLLIKAREKVTFALVNGSAIRIEGGNYIKDE
ncbi:MAG: DUF134 domain-containing protein [Candidatus Woesearchaeota archaeon]|jgi:predicted DNA-binding protein (UPF0251 family)|nr:DUF134 domain-containing protein [Candidatus Woesearchaeota archaeon]